MESFKKTIRLATTSAYGSPCSVFCSIKFTDGKLSITGVEGPMKNGNCRGGAGQIVMLLTDDKTLSPVNGIDTATMQSFLSVWNRWHLNDLRAGDAEQEQFLREKPLQKDAYAYPKDYFTAASEYLAANGLNPHNGYKYGHAWKREEVPAEVVQFLQSLPDTDIVPAWV